MADITYVHLAEEFAYLAIIPDAFSRKVVGCALEGHLRAELALAARRPTPGSLVHHSDRGVQYACGDYVARLASHDIRPSMSRVGNPYDNAKAKRFMRTLKEEEVAGSAYRDATEVRASIGLFIETIYRQRLDFVSWKDRRGLATSLKDIYRATGADAAEKALTDHLGAREDRIVVTEELLLAEIAGYFLGSGGGT